MAKKVAFRHKEKDGRFQTQDRNGSEVLVTGDQAFTTDDPSVIAELDDCEHVKRDKPSEED